MNGIHNINKIFVSLIQKDMTKNLNSRLCHKERQERCAE